MNGLKKFQEFALNADEQKNVKGGLLANRWWRCWQWTSSGGIGHFGDFNGDQLAVANCNRNRNCAGCEPIGFD